MTTLKERLAATIMIDPTSGLEAPINPDGAEALARIEALERHLAMFVNTAKPRRPDGHHEMPLFTAEEIRRARLTLEGGSDHAE